MKNGIRYAYTGNVHDSAGGSTYCHGCGALLIGRDWYELGAWNLTDEGACARCGTACAGVFEGAPGRLGTPAPAGAAAGVRVRWPARDREGIERAAFLVASRGLLTGPRAMYGRRRA